ncbi:DUF2993 domain-containing protein [Streptomyces sp. WMMC500]|uniref:LmeA family phospholipid-binding protein n=1 Tax=Streptomyces sp. WMMC500 TaxID=3015154 RepID=UPI00248B4952|nr:DUF2993 domain-containing protein [Streptomyces sp. WMMC500]WBB58422.1 DUF2993 domain-containing protein [Streptomyces sp. WMMC500]
MRALKITGVVLVVLGVLAVAADRIALRFAESNAADRIEKEYGLSQRPDIDIKGFPFLTQVMSREFEAVDVRIDGIDAVGSDGRSLRLDGVRGELEGVRIEGDDWDRATADKADGKVTITYADISAALPVIEVAYGGKGAAGENKVKATVGTSFLGQRLEESLLGKVSVVDGDTIRLRATDVDNLRGVPGLEDFVRDRMDYNWTIEDLPPGIRLTDVDVTKDGIVITGSGRDVELGDERSAGN